MNFPYLKSGDSMSVMAWAKQVVTLFNGQGDALSSLPGNYANDAAAAAAGVGVNGAYIDTAGIARRRLV